MEVPKVFFKAEGDVGGRRNRPRQGLGCHQGQLGGLAKQSRNQQKTPVLPPGFCLLQKQLD
jgi:hypothetical protein